MADNNIDSILLSMKMMLGMEPEYTPFDTDIIIHINSCLSKLNQIGVGPSEGFKITDETQTWEDFIGTNPKLNMVKTWMYVSLRVLFDPPQNSFTLQALQEQAEEYLTRLSYEVDAGTPVD